MDQFWRILGLEPTKDLQAIRRAYARAARQYHPEEQPEEFQQVRSAYEQALLWAGQGAVAGGPAVSTNPGAQPEQAKPPSPWTLPGLEEPEEDIAAPFLAHPAMEAFRALYQDPKLRGNSRKWMDYFTSEDFLDVWRTPGFSAALHREVLSQCGGQPPNRVFLRELSIAYGVRYTKWVECADCDGLPSPDGAQIRYESRLLPNAGFQGVEQILAITGLGHPVLHLSQPEERMRAAGFLDYTALLAMARAGIGADNRGAYQSRLRRYQRVYLMERPPADDRRSELDLLVRHPSSLRLLRHFFAHENLSQEAYQLAWSILDLKSAGMGSNKLWYGQLQEIILAKAPQVTQVTQENFLEADRAYHQYRSRAFARSDQDTPEDQAEVDALFARPDLQRALLRPDFSDKVLSYWLDQRRTLYFLEQMRRFCLSHPNSQEAARLLTRTNQLLAKKETEAENQADEAGEISRDLSLTNRPFWRYFLTTAFPMAQALERDLLLAPYLIQRLSPSMVWRKRFLGFDEARGELPAPPSLSIQLQEALITVTFRLHYIQYQCNDQPAWGPLFPWTWTRELEDGPLFWLLLPRTWALWDVQGEVRQTLEARLAKLPIPPDALPQVADCLTGYLCTRREAPETVFAAWGETAEQLYGCTVDRDGLLTLFKERPEGRAPLPNQTERFQTPGEAQAEGLRRLEALTCTQDGLEMPPLSLLPQWVETQPATPLRNHIASAEELHTLLVCFLKGELRRLELSWGDAAPEEGGPDLTPEQSCDSLCRSLVLLRERDQMLCLYFDDRAKTWYALLGVPEEYFEGDSSQTQYRPFGLGRVERYLLHRSTALLRRQLPKVLAQLGRPGGRLESRRDWVARTSNRNPLAYNRAKQELGRFPPQRARNWLKAGFELPCRPERICCTDLEGQQSQELGQPCMKDLVQYHLNQFLQGRLSKLELSWRNREGAPGEAPEWDRSISMFQEEGWYRLTYSDARQKFHHHLVADQRAYLDAEGPKIPKRTFQGRKVETYLLHEGPVGLRDALDLLLPNIAAPAALLNQFGVWAPRPF